MNEGPDFSIIIPSYNRASFLMKAIQSVLNQTHTNFELIVVDDGSTDNTRELIENSTDPRLKYIFQQNAERAAARNKGAQLAIGKYITFFDSDDLLFSNHLAEAQKFVDLHQGIECFHQGYQIRNTVTGKVKKVTNKKETCNAKLIEGNGLSCNGVFLRNDIAKSNLFNENRNLSGLEDWELWLRIAVSFPIYSNPVITSEIIDHNDRSVVNADKIKLIKKMDLFMDLVLNNAEIQSYYKHKINKFKASCYTYVSLHLALMKKNKYTAVKFLCKGTVASPSFLFQRRFLAIIKHLIL